MGYVRDIDLRGLEADSLRTRLYSRFRYADLYDIELSTADNQQAAANLQFHTQRDPGDGKEKLTGIWLEGVSTMDVKRAPDIIWEVSEGARTLLAPYQYQLPPLIEFRSSSAMQRGSFVNDIELLIESPTAFSYHGFALDSLEAQVFIGEDTVDIPFALASLGGGNVELSAFMVGDALDLEVDAMEVGFGELLLAANSYFAESGSESARSTPAARLLAFEGLFTAKFQGRGIAGDATSFIGSGDFSIAKADFGKFQLFGALSKALEITPMGFTTLKFDTAAGSFSLDKEELLVEKSLIQGPVAQIESSGRYDLEADELDFKARLYPFRNSKVPLLSPIINFPLNLVSNVFEAYVRGNFADPQLTLFSRAEEKQEEGESSNARPAPR